MKLQEKTRAELLNKSKSADLVKSYGTTRYDRRGNQKVFDVSRTLNSLNFNSLFKNDNLIVDIKVQGETSDYSVKILFEGICKDLQKEIELNNGVLEFKCVYRAIVSAINNYTIKVACSCPD